MKLKFRKGTGAEMLQESPEEWVVLCCLRGSPLWCLWSSLPLRALSGSVALLQWWWGVMFVVCAIARNHMEDPWSVLPLTKKRKEVTFAVIPMIAYAQLRGWDMEASVKIPTHTSIPPMLSPKSNSLNRKLRKRTLKKGDGDTEE